MAIVNGTDALGLLIQLGAAPRLVRHHELVLEAASELLAGLREFATSIGAQQVEIGSRRSVLDVFGQADELFERVAAGGDQRLARSI